MTPRFVHLRLHSEFSLVDGLVRIKPLMKSLKEKGMPAVALTDCANLFAMVKFQKAAFSEGIKPIFGADLRVFCPETDLVSSMTLLVQNEEGYKNLTELVSQSYQEGQKLGLAYTHKKWILGKSAGLIALSGGREGDICKILSSDGEALATACAKEWAEAFPNSFYIELQRTGREGEDDAVQALVPLADDLGLPLVATNDVRFLKTDEYEIHEARVCINEGRTLDDPRREKKYSVEQYLKSEKEMLDLFEDLPDAIQNTVEIAKRCNLNIPLGESFLPNYPVPEGMTIDSFFNDLSAQGLEDRLETILDKNLENYGSEKQIYLDRLKFELDIINQMGFPGYFLIVMDFIRWAKQNDVPVGPGRGSGAGSLVAYALEITDLDPIEYDLLFERFLNPERVSMPDFDIDFCMDGRDRVIEYVAETYGRDAVSQIITFGTMAAKAVVRDVARVQGKSYGLADRLSKMIPFEVGMTLTKAMEQEQALRDFVDQDEEAGEIMEVAFKLEGLTRNVGKHAGGVVISPTKLTDFTSLYCDETGAGLVTQFDKDDVEQVGLVKFDFLGLRTLTIIDWALKDINSSLVEEGGQSLLIEDIDLNDKRSFDVLQASQTTAVFQLESRGMKDLITRLQPNSFEDIIALVALFRPGPLQSGMVDDFINRKHGRAAVEYPHEDLAPILENTYGVILYQEQVMQIAQVLANYSLGQADMLRRAMGKKKPEEMEKQRELFSTGAKARGIEESVATYVFDLMEKFAGYGFNKSHSAAYALVSYQTLWLKANYPSQLMAAVLSADLDNTDKIVILVEECRSMEINLLPPSVNSSEYKFTTNDLGQVIYGMGSIKGVGEGPIESIVEEREQNGEFADLFEFCRRLTGKKVNRKVVEALIKSGAMDIFNMERSVLFANLSIALQAADQYASNQSAGMGDLFGSGESNSSPEAEYLSAKEWSENDRLQGEKETLGLYLTGHPYDQYEKEVKLFTSSRIVDLRTGQKIQVIGGLVVSVRAIPTKRGGKIAFVSMDDRSGRIEVTLFPELFEKYAALLQKDAILVMEGEVSHDDYTGNLKLTANKVSSLVEAREHYASDIRIQMHHAQLPKNYEMVLKNILQAHLADPPIIGPDGLVIKKVASTDETEKQGCDIVADYEGVEAKALIKLGQEWRVKPAEQLLQALREEFGAGSVSLSYK